MLKKMMMSFANQVTLSFKPVLSPISLTVYRVVILQLLLVIFFSLLILCFNQLTAFSFFLGGITVVLPSFYMAWRVSKCIDARKIQKMIKAFYRAEFVKLLTVAVLTILLTQLLMVSLLPFFVGLLTTHVGVAMAFLLMY